jgi:hypothetical protein
MTVTEANKAEAARREAKAVLKIYDDLAVAFAGYSQISQEVFGMALAGHINNGNLGQSSPEDLAQHAAATVADRWDCWEDYDEMCGDILAACRLALPS